MLKIFFLFLVLLTIIGTTEISAELRKLDKKMIEKLRDLDDRLFDVEDRLGGKKPMTPIDAFLSRFGGVIFHDQKMSFSEKYEGSSNTTDLNTETRIDLIFAGDVTDQLEYLFVPAWFFMSERNFADQADRNSKETRLKMNLVYRINGTYKISNAFQVKFGRFVAPFSSYVDTYSPSAEQTSHWPQMVMPQGGLLFSTVLDGLQIGGTTRIKRNRFTYRIYAAVHGTDQAVYTDHPVAKYLFKGQPNKMIIGVRTILDIGNKISVGLSVQGGRRRAGYTALGTDINLKFGKFKIRGEFMTTKETLVKNSYDVTTINNHAAACGGGNANDCNQFEKKLNEYYITRLDSNKSSYYVEPSYWINNKWMVAARYDYIDMKNIFNHGKSKTITGFSLNYFPKPQLMIKVNYNMHDYESDDANNAFTNGNAPAAFVSLYEDTSQTAINANPDYNEGSISATLSF